MQTNKIIDLEDYLFKASVKTLPVAELEKMLKSVRQITDEVSKQPQLQFNKKAA